MPKDKNSIDAHWILAQVKPNSLRIAELNLSRQGFKSFSPWVERTIRAKNQLVRKKSPLFPGYVFIEVQILNPYFWRSVNYTRGLSRLVSFGNQPARVPLELIDEMRMRYGKEGNIAQNDLAVGDPAMIIHGPFTDFFAEVEIVAAESRVTLLVDFLGRITRVSAATSDVMRVDKSSDPRSIERT